MRRVLLFAAFLLLLGLTTATAASFDVQAEDITSFSQSVDIEVPPLHPLPQDTYFLTGGFSTGIQPLGSILLTAPTVQTPVATGKFQPITPNSIDTETKPPESGNRVWYMAWSTGPLEEGISLRGHQLELIIDPSSSTGTVTVAAYRCDSEAPEPTVTQAGCSRLSRWSGSVTSRLISQQIVADIPPGKELRIKVVNETLIEWTIQWGYKSNRPSAIVVSRQP